MDRIDSEYYRHSSRLNVKDETRLKATSEEVAKWAEGASSCEYHFLEYRLFLTEF